MCGCHNWTGILVVVARLHIGRFVHLPFLSLIKCGKKVMIFQHFFLFHSFSLDGLSVSLTAVVEIPSASINFFFIFMRFLAPQHGDEGWNQQEMMEFWLLQCSPYSCCLRKKKEEENRRKNRCLRMRKKMAIEGRKKCTKRAWQLPESSGFIAIMGIFAIVRVIKYNTIQYNTHQHFNQ